MREITRVAFLILIRCAPIHAQEETVPAADAPALEAASAPAPTPEATPSPVAPDVEAPPEVAPGATEPLPQATPVPEEPPVSTEVPIASSGNGEETGSGAPIVPVSSEDEEKVGPLGIAPRLQLASLGDEGDVRNPSGQLLALSRYSPGTGSDAIAPVEAEFARLGGTPRSGTETTATPPRDAIGTRERAEAERIYQERQSGINTQLEARKAQIERDRLAERESRRYFGILPKDGLLTTSRLDREGQEKADQKLKDAVKEAADRRAQAEQDRDRRLQDIERGEGQRADEARRLQDRRTADAQRERGRQVDEWFKGKLDQVPAPRPETDPRRVDPVTNLAWRPVQERPLPYSRENAQAILDSAGRRGQRQPFSDQDLRAYADAGMPVRQITLNGRTYRGVQVGQGADARVVVPELNNWYRPERLRLGVGATEQGTWQPLRSWERRSLDESYRGLQQFVWPRSAPPARRPTPPVGPQAPVRPPRILMA